MVRASGTVDCWGSYHAAWPGAAPVAAGHPFRIPDIDDALAIDSGGGGRTCVVRRTGGVRCWSGPVGTRLVNPSREALVAARATALLVGTFDVGGDRLRDATMVRSGYGDLLCIGRRDETVGESEKENPAGSVGQAPLVQG